MKPWMTEAIGTQNVLLPSSVDQPERATEPKFSMPLRSVTGARCPFLNNSSEASNGRQVIRSPAVPASSLEFSAALYSVGAVGENTTLMPGFAFSKAGMILSCQIGKSSLRQLSIVSVTSLAGAAAGAGAGAVDAVCAELSGCAGWLACSSFFFSPQPANPTARIVANPAAVIFQLCFTLSSIVLLAFLVLCLGFRGRRCAETGQSPAQIALFLLQKLGGMSATPGARRKQNCDLWFIFCF